MAGPVDEGPSTALLHGDIQLMTMCVRSAVNGNDYANTGTVGGMAAGHCAS